MKYLLLGLLVGVFFIGVFGGIGFIVTALFTWYAPWAGLGIVMIIVGLLAALAATYVGE